MAKKPRQRGRGKTVTPVRNPSAERKAAREEAALQPFLEVPKGVFCLLAGGRGRNAIDEHARRYGLPGDTSTINLQEFVSAHYDWFAKHSLAIGRHILRGTPDAEEATGDDAVAFAGPNSPALERLRIAKAQIAELELEQKRLQTFSKDEVTKAFRALATSLRKGVEVLQRRFGEDARLVYEEALQSGMAALRRELKIEE